MSGGTMRAAAAAPPRDRLLVVCMRCGAARETHGLHYCPVVRCDPPHDDRRDRTGRSPALVLASQMRGVE
jgi:hypothetical protein